MKIIGATWTAVVNLLLIECICDNKFYHRADRWNVKCHNCGGHANLRDLREAIKPGDIKES